MNPRATRPLFLLSLLLLGTLNGCLQDDQETSDWFCGYYHSCKEEPSAKCALYGNCE